MWSVVEMVWEEKGREGEREGGVREEEEGRDRCRDISRRTRSCESQKLMSGIIVSCCCRSHSFMNLSHDGSVEKALKVRKTLWHVTVDYVTFHDHTLLLSLDTGRNTVSTEYPSIIRSTRQDYPRRRRLVRYSRQYHPSKGSRLTIHLHDDILTSVRESSIWQRSDYWMT